MLRVRNSADIPVLLRVPGVQAVANDLDVLIAPFNCVIDSLYAKLGTAGVTGTQVTDIKLNGVSIFASGGLSFASNSQACTYGTLTNNPQKLNKGDVLRLDTTAVNSGTPGKDLAVWIVLTRQRSGFSQGSMETDTLSSASDTI